MKNNIIILLLVYLFSCKEEDKPCSGNNLVVPVALNLIVLDKDGKNIITENTSTALVYFIDDQGRKVYTNKNNGAGIEIFGDPTKYKYYYSDLGIALASTGATKTFYFDFMGKIDTIYLDNQINPKFDPCGNRQMKYEEKEVLLNGKQWEHDESVIPPVYVIQRK